MSKRAVRISLRKGDASAVDGDVIGLKYAQEFHGVDGVFAERLSIRHGPKTGEHALVACPNTVGVREALFVGVRPLFMFRYAEIREFARRVLELLADERPSSRRLVMTLHGPGYGLDETEAALAEIAGLEDAVRAGRIPAALEEIVIVELDPSRVDRISRGVRGTLGDGAPVAAPDAWASYVESVSGHTRVHPQMDSDALGSVGASSEAKPHVFVAMPFTTEMDDVYHYGIQNVVNGLGWLCERIDREPFVGDVLDQIKNRIRSAKVVIAELTGANPNVYLELGYAWGVGRPTILVARTTDDLRFDVRGQRCLSYARIQDLERGLRQEVEALRTNGLL